MNSSCVLFDCTGLMMIQSDLVIHALFNSVYRLLVLCDHPPINDLSFLFFLVGSLSDMVSRAYAC